MPAPASHLKLHILAAVAVYLSRLARAVSGSRKYLVVAQTWRYKTSMGTLSDGALFAGYRIEGPIGRGGMGVIYRAAELRPKGVVALKVVAPEIAADAEFRARFLRESQTAASIEHPHVVPVLRVGEEDDLLFIAMRLILGDGSGESHS